MEASDTNGAQWQVGLDRLRISASNWAGASYVLAEPEQPPQVTLPADDDIVDASALPSSPASRRRPAKRPAGRHEPDVHALDDPDELGVWSVRDPDLARLLGREDSLALQAFVQSELQARAPDLLARVEFDSERACFFAYCPADAEARRLGDLLSDLTQRPGQTR